MLSLLHDAKIAPLKLSRKKPKSTARLFGIFQHKATLTQ
jgi:hypothetical protein